MPRTPLILAALLAAASLPAQQIPDPANLTGEHVAPQSLADTLPINHGAPALQQLLLKLRTRASMMLIVAHPDDEDGGLLTYESRGQGARVAMLTLTRGEGGQNLMSADFNDALGLIRTQELLAADRYFGVDQFFGTEVDFGFSKTKEETLQKWTHDRVLYDAVRAVRLYRPLVLASVFVGGPTDGHGHHQVSGEICQEVFLAAADPKVFPEMIAQGLPPWAPLKVYARVPFSRVGPDGMYDYATGRTIPARFHNYVTDTDTSTPPQVTVQIHEGERSQALGMDGDTYVQFARKGLALQKTQIGANVRLAPPGAYDAPYTLMASRLGCSKSSSEGTPGLQARVSQGQAMNRALAPGVCPLPTTEQSLFQGIDTTLAGLADLAPSASRNLKLVIKTNLAGLDDDIAEATLDMRPGHPELAANRLREGLVGIDMFIKNIEETKVEFLPEDEKFNLLHELRIKRVQLNNALILALGLDSTATLAESTPLIPGAPYKVSLGVNKSGPQAASLVNATLHLTGDPVGIAFTAPSLAPLLPGRRQTMDLTARVPANASPTEPYFHQDNPEQAVYTVDNPALRNAPQTPSPVVATLQFNFEGASLDLPVIVSAPVGVASSPLQPAVIVPQLSISVTPAVAAVPTSLPKPRVDFAVSVRTNQSQLEPRIELGMPPNWKVASPEDDFVLKNIGDSHTVSTSVIVSGLRDDRSNLSITLFAKDSKHKDSPETDLGYRSVGYPGITLTNLYRHAVLRVAPVDVTTAPNLHIAYLPGTGDAVPDFLPNLGITPTLITPVDLTPEKLKQFDAVILGVRAYAAQSALANKGSQPLLDYASNGGVVILQYMTARYGDSEAPYPISVPGDPAHNVVVEAAPVQVLTPTAPIMTWPNKITSADFDNWVEERGHGFAATWSPSYTPLLETHDPDQDPQKGGLLLAPVGKGAYIYCALAIYRQLPEGVPGAYRLLANLLSYAKNPHR